MTQYFVKKLSLAAVLTFVAAAPYTASAVIISGGFGDSAPLNETAPADDPGWAHVGRMGTMSSDNATGVYLGNGWALTANHVGGKGSIMLGGSQYNALGGTGQQLLNPDGTLTDLYIFKLNIPVTDPIASLPVLEIADTTPTSGTDGIFIGTGYTQNSATPDLAFGSVIENGFNVSTTERAKKWSPTEVTNSPTLSDVPLNLQHLFFTQFSVLEPSGQAANKDSGSSIFVKNNDDEWVLAGLAHFILGEEGQPNNTAVHNNLTAWSDLSVYRDQIYNIIPEPGSIALLAATLVPLLTTRQRRRA
ncbi:hypothetical protein KS4_03370 [Poriferisphaera corsica]|uniref:Peptidase S1 domain-containing protein n=1 Tax=Poriferisphaera corsica TaxID=2528020 RepID=A0A517YQ05_9BACT|nr:trypsin-like serine protease [Poriferisphaera corsica]QDU32305.1 hypothetical protein KS4_03370 [Poriferisphaera corsica]